MCMCVVYVNVHVCASTCVCMGVHGHACVYMCVGVLVCMYMYVHGRACVYMSVGVLVCTCAVA